MSRSDDRVAIRALLDAYADVVCVRAWDELDALFHPDITITIAVAGRDPIELVGPGEFRAFVAPAVDQFDFFLFQIVNARIDFVGEHRATGRTFMTELRQDQSGFTQVYGRYDDTFGRIDGRWRFEARSYRTLARSAAAGPPFDVF